MSRTGSDEAHHLKMIGRPIPRLTMAVSLPAIVATLINTVYNTVDTFYAAKLGTSEAAAIGVAFSIMTTANAVGFLMGMGAGTLIGRHLGAGDRDTASTIASTSFFLTLGLSAVLGILGFVFIGPLMTAFGATATNHVYAVEYGRILVLGFPIMTGSLVLSTIIRCEGKTVYSMIGIGAGGILSVGLAPLFMFALKLKVTGAAVNDLVCQSVSFVILLSFYLRGKSAVHFSVHRVSRDPKVLLAILRTGLPSLTRHLIGSFANISLNFAAKPFGDVVQASMGIVMKLLNLSQSFTNGMCQGTQTVFAYNYGAGKYRRVKEAFRFTLILNTLILAVIGLAEIFAAPQIVAFFRDEADIIGTAAPGVRIQAAAMILIPSVTLPNMLFQSVGESFKSSFLASLRQGVLYIPLVLLLPRLWQVRGLQLAQPLADLLSLTIVVPMLLSYLHRELDPRIEAESAARD